MSIFLSFSKTFDPKSILMRRLATASRVSQVVCSAHALRQDGADALLFACTGEFPEMRGDTGVVFPSRVLAATNTRRSTLPNANRFGDLRRQHVELVPKDKDFGFQRSPRPEQSDQGAPDQPAKIAHRD
jgi:hypothetical protein